MPCDLATTQASACVSGTGKVTDPLTLLQVIAENFAETSLANNSANTNTVAAILSRACDSGIGKITDENALWRIIAQNLCSLSNSDTPSSVCALVTISGAGTSEANQTYTKVSDTVYVGNSNPDTHIILNSGTGLWEIVSSISDDLYIQSGTFPLTWTFGPAGSAPVPTGVCS